MKALLTILLFLPLFLLGACGETTTPQSMPQIAGTAEDLELQVKNGMTLEQVYDVMTPELKKQSIVYPAQSIVQQSDGKWQFTAKEGGSPGDTDAPFQVLVFIPSPIGDPYYMIFFDNEKVLNDAWFEYEDATGIQKLLWTTESTDQPSTESQPVTENITEPEPVPSPPPTPEPSPEPELVLEIVSVTSPIYRGFEATLVAKTVPGAECTIIVSYSSGVSKASGLEPKIADSDGNVSWSWKVGSKTTAGSYPIVVQASYQGKTASQETHFTVVE